MYFCIMRAFKKYFEIAETPDQVFLALTNPTTLLLWTGEPAEGTDVVGSDFYIYGGSIQGRVVELEAPKKIVQEWFFGEQEEKSIVTLLLHPHSAGTSIELRHTNIPDEVYDEIVAGWTEMFFPDLKEFYLPE